jgi:hypothetical protein
MACILAAGLVAGCGGDARVELTAADALNEVAGQMAGTIEEYHADVSKADASRESSIVAAFVGRVRQDAADEAALAGHVSDFEQALQKVRSDRETEWSRKAAAAENVSVLREIARGLQRLAIESLGVQDEVKRYLQNWIAAREQKNLKTAMNADARP